MNRLFFAVELEEKTQQEISARAARLKPLWPRARWVKPPNYHLTMLFIGRYSGQLSQLEEAGHRAAASRGGMLAACSWGYFPHKSRPRVAFAAVEDRENILRGISESLNCILRSQQNNSFHPHITVARSNGQYPAPSADFGPPVLFACRHITLFNSELAPGGPRYTKVACFALQGIARSE